VEALEKGWRTVRIKEELADKVDEAVREGLAKSRADFVEKACKDLLRKKLKAGRT
jgi:Arc/MetJ-type ribon-helix-helix transcriptional regulator